MNPSEQVEARLLQVRAELSARKNEVARLAGEAFTLERQLKELKAQDEDSDSDEGDGAMLLGLPELPQGTLGTMTIGQAPWYPQAASSLAPPPPPAPAYSVAAMPTLMASQVSPLAVTPASLPPVGTQSVLIASSEPASAYSYFTAGHGYVKSLFLNLVMMPCHISRSYEITNISLKNLASKPEKKVLRDYYSTNVMEQHTVLNFIVWRRSTLLSLFLMSTAALGFAAFGDNWVAYQHMQEMQELSQFNTSYEAWKLETEGRLDIVECSKIDQRFVSVLNSMESAHHLHGHTCAEVVASGIKCTDTLASVIDGCWQPGLCQELVSGHCPGVCGSELMCRDTHGGKDLSYAAFTTDFMASILHKLMEQLSRAELAKSIFTMIAKFIASLFIMQAAMHWADWTRSNRLVLYAWLCTFSTPFMRSVVPTPLLIDWAPIDEHMNLFLLETDQHYNVTGQMKQLGDLVGLSCSDTVLEDNVRNTFKKTDKKFHWWCSKVKTAAVWLPWSKTVQRSASQCSMVSDYMGVGGSVTVETQKKKAEVCGFFNTSHVKKGPMDTIGEVVDVSWIRSAAYGLVGSLSASFAFRAALPEALSVAPGLLAAAIRIKVVAPQSFLPGVFIIITPLLYVPVVWSFCILIVQSSGDPFLLMGITLLVFSPLTYMLFGVSFSVASPMSRSRVTTFATNVRYCNWFMQGLALSGLVAYFFRLGERIEAIEERGQGIAAFLIEQTKRLLLPLIMGSFDSVVDFLTSGPVWSFIFTCVTEVYLTAVVGSDWMLRASVEEWNAQGQEHLVDLEEEGFLGDVSAERLHNQRLAAMTAMLELTAKTRVLGH